MWLIVGPSRYKTVLRWCCQDHTMVSDYYPRLHTIIDEWQHSIRTAMATDNGGTKVSCDFKADLHVIYRSNIHSDLIICSLVSCSYHVAVSLGLVPSFSQKIILSSCNFTRTDKKQCNRWTSERRGDTDAWLCEDGIFILPLSKCRGNVSIRSASVHNRTNIVLNCIASQEKPISTLVIRSLAVWNSFHHSSSRLHYLCWIIVKTVTV